MKTFLLVDDHIVVRSGMKGILSEVFSPCEIHEAGDGDGALEQLKQHIYDLILMDLIRHANELIVHPFQEPWHNVLCRNRW